MSSKTDKLAQKLQEFQRFVTVRSDRDTVYLAVEREVEKMSAWLKSGKINVQIYSRFPVLAQGLQNLLNSEQNLRDLYDCSCLNLPIQPQVSVANSPAAIILNSSFVGMQKRYAISSREKIVIGRRLDCQIKVPDELSKISGHHVEIEPYGKGSLSWQICDLNSANGTYINGEKLNGCRILQAGDKISLAYPFQDNNGIEFVFECLQTSTEEDEVSKELAEGDIFCLVINAGGLIGEEEKYLLKKVFKCQKAKFILVADTSGSSGQVTPAINAAFAEVKTLIERENPRLILEFVPLFLRAFYGVQNTVTEPNLQAEVNKFTQSLESFGKKEVENIVIRRIGSLLLLQIARLEAFLEVQEGAIVKEIQKIEADLQAGIQSEKKEQTRKAIKKANDEKEKFFKEVKNNLSQSKSDFLDSFRKKSIVNKIELFTENLMPVVTKKGNETYIQLFSESTTNAGGVTNAMSYLCRSEILQWGTEEWRRIYNDYAEGGLWGMSQRISAMLNVIPSVGIVNYWEQPNSNMDFSRSLDASLVEFSCETRYQEGSFWSSIFKQGKTYIFLLGGGGIIAAINKFVQKSTGVKIADEGLLVLGILGVVISFTFTYINYENNKTAKRKEAGEKLKKELSSYYQSLAKSLVEKLVQAFSLRLEAEERRIREALDAVNERFAGYFVDLEKGQTAMKSCLAEQKVRQTELKKEKLELDKFKQLSF